MELETRGYDAVIAAVRKKLDDPHASPQRWLADKLGITRQTTHRWRDNGGIPPKYVNEISRLTGLTEDQIRPEGIRIHLPDDIMEAVRERASKREGGFLESLTFYIRKGLKLK